MSMHNCDKKNSDWKDVADVNETDSVAFDLEEGNSLKHHLQHEQLQQSNIGDRRPWSTGRSVVATTLTKHKPAFRTNSSGASESSWLPMKSPFSMFIASFSSPSKYCESAELSSANAYDVSSHVVKNKTAVEPSRHSITMKPTSHSTTTVCPVDMNADFDIRMMDNLQQWPFVAVTLIHIRVLLFQLTHNELFKRDGYYLIYFTLLSCLSFIVLLISHCGRKGIVTHFNRLRMTLEKLDSFSIIFITTCFSGILLLLSFHDRGILSRPPEHLVFEGHTGCTLHNEFIFYVMMIPFLLYSRSVHALGYAVYTAWGTALATTCISIMLITFDNHAKHSLPYALGVMVVSLAILVHSRKQRVSELNFYRQFEDLKCKYNELSMQFESKEKELVHQRFIIANTAHDLKTVSIRCIYSFLLFDD